MWWNNRSIKVKNRIKRWKHPRDKIFQNHLKNSPSKKKKRDEKRFENYKNYKLENRIFKYMIWYQWIKKTIHREKDLKNYYVYFYFPSRSKLGKEAFKFK